MKIPEILTSLSGEQITSTDMWEKYRRNEIYTLFENFVYEARQFMVDYRGMVVGAQPRYGLSANG